MDIKDRELLKKIRGAPNEGMCEVIELYMPTVKAICRHILAGLGNDVIDDAVQETFIKVWVFARSGKKLRGSLKGLIYQTARNQCLDMLRERKRKSDVCINTEDIYAIESLMSECGADLESIFVRKYNYQMIHEVIEQMEEPDRRIFILRYFYNYKIREIAVDVNLSEDNVESRIRRKREHLMKQLKERGVLYEG